MKKHSLLYLLIFFLLACSDDKSNMPRLELAGIFLNGEDEDYSRKLKEILPLSSGDYIDVSFILDGNGTDLKTFVVKNDNQNINATMFFIGDEISDDFSNLSEGILGYKDGIQSTFVTVKLKVKSAKDENLEVKFYLNSKAPDCVGAEYKLKLTTTTLPREIVMSQE